MAKKKSTTNLPPPSYDDISSSSVAKDKKNIVSVRIPPNTRQGQMLQVRDPETGRIFKISVRGVRARGVEARGVRARSARILIINFLSYHKNNLYHTFTRISLISLFYTKRRSLISLFYTKRRSLEYQHLSTLKQLRKLISRFSLEHRYLVIILVVLVM